MIDPNVVSITVSLFLLFVTSNAFDHHVFSITICVLFQQFYDFLCCFKQCGGALLQGMVTELLKLINNS